MLGIPDVDCSGNGLQGRVLGVVARRAQTQQAARRIRNVLAPGNHQLLGIGIEVAAHVPVAARQLAQDRQVRFQLCDRGGMGQPALQAATTAVVQ